MRNQGDKKFSAGGMKVVSASGGPISVVGLDAAYGVTEIHPTPNDPAYLRGWPFDGKPASTPVEIEWYNDRYMAKAGDLSYVIDRSNYTQAERAAMSERTGNRTKKFGYNPTPYQMGKDWGEMVKGMIASLEAARHRTGNFERRVNPDDEYGIEHQWGFFIREYPSVASWTPAQKAEWGRGYNSSYSLHHLRRHSTQALMSERTGHRFVAPRGLFG